MGQYAQGNQKQQKCHFHKKNAGSVQNIVFMRLPGVLFIPQPT